VTAAGAAGFRRVKRGSGHSYTLDGEPLPGVTSVLRDGVPKNNLTGWAARSVAGYALDHWDDLAGKGSAERLRELERAPWAERDAAAARGRDVHDYAARLAGGEEIDVPEHLVGHVDSYLQFVEDWRVTEVAVEVPVVNRRWKYGGTLDLLATFADDPHVVVIDWKTGASGVWPETALQCAAYAHAEHMLNGDGSESPLPPIVGGFGVWLRADGYDLLPLNITDDVFRVFLYAMQVAAFTNSERSDYVRAALTPPARLQAVES
jgi:PD-(D/E)XK nuclease superfamily protein